MINDVIRMRLFTAKCYAEVHSRHFTQVLTPSMNVGIPAWYKHNLNLNKTNINKHNSCGTEIYRLHGY